MVSICLDTNIVIPFLSDDFQLVQKIRQAAEVFIPVIVLGELMYGAKKSVRPTENIATIEAFMGDNVIVDCTRETAHKYGDIKEQLRKDGHPIPENDIWIAAIALQDEFTLVSRDTHFSYIKGLSLAMW
ncbi:PIN domain-containing protein [candidate division KSB3 bacterium]|uniref:Ribonuclease VapC n=1 Tax=candidate division KSB3 bacterium TaxID=2044937 RepID=A0A9D5Q4C3_9BACT|nr:PIN domain-containing protein [candidate division KSB3 bacterium]MBD3323564.1 PIN domain-containing protein [candidate division KSB3 bacterium]